MSGIYTTIVVKKPTRELLRQIGHKNQTYDQLINELVNISKNSKDKKAGARPQTSTSTTNSETHPDSKKRSL